MATISRVGNLVLSRTALLLCDMQEKFRPTVSYFDAIVETSSRMLTAARILGMTTVVTEIMFGFQRMCQSGVYLTTCESALLTILCGSDHPQFRDIQKIILNPSPDSGLLTGLNVLKIG
ncbi:Isochorismatase domain-containing protein 2 [Schistosoma japonicum]|nr:Isochorismatase domain-containing protein 2 [Schistosoma japonicum]